MFRHIVKKAERKALGSFLFLTQSEPQCSMEAGCRCRDEQSRYLYDSGDDKKSTAAAMDLKQLVKSPRLNI
ncbi:hypothetical protein AOG23_04530 [Rhizobium acidisoli]|nr:hypothetical protein AOG23_04530 [Rhizobium acidisoli]